MQILRVGLDAEISADVDMVVGFHFTGTGEGFTIHVRKGGAEITEGFPENPASSIRASSFVWKEILAKRRNPALAFASGDEAINGSTINMLSFLSLFQPPEN